MAEAEKSEKKPKQECIVRSARDIDEARELWWPLMQELGWNRAENDIKTHYPSATKNSGEAGWLVVAGKSDPDRAEGCIVPFVFDNKTGWVGYFCVNTAKQGLGWGAALFKECLDTFSKAGVEYAGLDAVEQQVKTYERRGFKATDRVKLMSRKSVDEAQLEGGFEHVETDGERLVPLEEVPSRVLVEHDLAISGMERGTLWSKEALFESRDDAWGLALVAHAAKDKDALDGWLLVRSCEHGYRFGPLYATNGRDAAFLLHQAMYRLQGQKGDYIAEVWDSNPLAVKVFEEAGWSWLEVDYHRMWLRGERPEAQREGCKARTECWAVFDAGEG